MQRPPGEPDMMRAAVRDRYGDESQIEVRTVPRPDCGPRDVIVRVTRASTGPDVWHILTGLPWAGRLAFGIPRPRSNRLGTDFAGVVEQTGDTVTGFAVGQRVAGHCAGAFAEYVRTSPANLSLIPAAVTDAQAAALPTSGATALAALDKVDISMGTTVLVIGAAGGIGHLLVQLATLRGASVTGVCRPEAAAAVIALGAADTLSYTTAALGDSGLAWDVILDTAGRRPVRELRRSLRPGGQIVVIGGEGGGRLLGGFGREQLSVPAAALAGQRVHGVFGSASAADTGRLLDLTASGRIRPLIHAEVPLEKAADAIRLQRRGHLRGKVILNFDDRL